MLSKVALYVICILIGLSFSSEAKERVCVIQDGRSSVGPIIIGQALPSNGIEAVVKVEVPSETDEVWYEVTLPCGKVLVELDGLIVKVISVRDSKISDVFGVVVGMKFTEIYKKIGASEIFFGEEEGGYLTLRSKNTLYIFSLQGISPQIFSTKKGLAFKVRNQILEEMRIQLFAPH